MEKLNGVTVYFNMADIDFYEKYMDNAGNVDKAMACGLLKEDTTDYRNTVVVLKEKCNGVKTFLDKVFGEGKGDEICGTGMDIVTCSEVYKSVIEIAERQTDEMNAKLREIYSWINSRGEKER